MMGVPRVLVVQLYQEIQDTPGYRKNGVNKWCKHLCVCVCRDLSSTNLQHLPEHQENQGFLVLL